MLTRLRLSNFRRHEETEIHFPSNSQLILISGENGSGKCLPGHVRVHDAATGESVPIEQFVAERRTKMLGSVNGKIVPVEVTDWHTLGMKQTFAVRLKNGATLEAAGTHPILTDRGCVRVEDLQEGDWVAEARTLPASGPERVSVDEAFLAGMLLGDGTCTTAFSWTNVDAEAIEAFGAALKRVFPHLRMSRMSETSLSYRVSSAWTAEERKAGLVELARRLDEAGVPISAYIPSGSIYRLRRGEAGIRYETLCEIEAEYGLELHDLKTGLYGGRSFHEWGKSLGLLGKNAHTKEIPANLLHLPEAQTLALLGGLWQTDGWFNPGGIAVFGTESKKLARDTRLLLLRLGILSSLRGPCGATKSSWRVCVRADSSRKFGIVPLVGDKAKRRDRGLEELSERTYANPNSDLVPPSFAAGLSTHSKSGRYRSPKQIRNHAMGRDLFLDFGGDPAVLEMDYTWSKIESVTPVGEAVPCFDVTVDTQEHLYVAETFIVHNSSLLESIQFAFYGESRHGKRNLDSLVRRGAELEGMEVELDFTIDEAEYSIKRRRVSKLATAVLYGNGNPLVEGTGPVTAEITKILGMDSSAFRLAVIAQQKELDGLASLRPAERAAQLSRLLRLDAVTRARDEARSIFRHEREVVKGIGTLDDIDALKAEEHTAAAAVAAANVALNESSASLLQLDADLAASSAVDAAYSQALTAAARAEGMVSNAETEVQRLSMDLSTLVVPVAVEPPSQTIEELALLATDVERAIARGEAAQQAASQHQMLTSERDRAQKRLDEVTPKLKGTSSKAVRGEQKALDAERQEITGSLAEAQETFTLLREQAASKDAELKMLQARKDRTSELGPLCDACGQDIPETHRHTQEEELEAQIQTGRLELESLFKAGREAKEAITNLTQRGQELTELLRGKAELAQTLEQLESERSELTRRRDTYDAQLSRIDLVEVDLEELYAKKGEIAIDVARAQQANEAIRARETVLSRKLDLDMALSGAQERLQAARGALATAEIDADLTAAYHERRRMAEVRSEEQTMLHHWSKEVAVAKERHTALTTAVTRAEKALERRRAHETKAQAAANAGRVLQVVEEVLNTQIRPALEGGVSEVLGTLSEGRFSAVRVDQDYNISVNDDGKLRPLTDLSGGELDLVALAVRLALAGVVSDRSGGGAGFLILDEIFGSQDTGRRESILAALRNLRATYGQILIISHVGGLEDSADVVIEVTAEEDDEGVRTASAKVA